MHVVALDIQNYLKVEAFHVEPDGKHVIISARNGEGKTSIVNALFEALRGFSIKERPEPVHRGADKARIEIDLGEYVIVKTLDDKGKTTMRVTAADGTKATSPQKLLDGLLNAYSLDPVAFLHKRSQDQLDDVLKICGVKPPVESVEQITGKKYPARFGESADQYMARLSADETGEVYRERRDANRDVDTCRGAVTKQKDMLNSLKTNMSLLRPAAEIMDEITRYEAEQHQFNHHQKAVEEVQTTSREISSLLNELQRDHDRGKDSIANQQVGIENAKKEIARLTLMCETAAESIRTMQQKQYELEARMNDGKMLAEETERKHKALLAERPQDYTKMIADRKVEWKLSDAQRERITMQQQAESRMEELEQDLIKSKAAHDRLDSVLSQLRQLRKDLLNGADLGVSGLSVGSGELLLHNVPFIQASQAQKLRVAAAVAMKTDANLKLLRIDNGELLDSESQQFLLDLATEYGWQVIMTRVSNDKELRVELVDGEDK